MVAVRSLDVRLTLSTDHERTVGTVTQSRQGCFFEYNPTFLDHPLWLSPFKLPPEPGLIEHRDRDFGPLFGLFDDSLPDGWGLLLMDRLFRSRDIEPASVSALDRLAFLGRRTMGALTYHPPSETGDDRRRALELAAMAEAARQVLAGRATDVLPELARAGGSPGGARPKVLVGVRGDEILSGEGNLPEGFRHWIVKFHAGADDADAGAVEVAYAEMARRAGIQIPHTRLFETAAGDRFFGVERFDRDGDRRIHVHTFGNLIHTNFRIPSCDYRQLLHVTRVLTRNHHDVIECFRRMVFNIATHNRDDHVKNFAFLIDEEGNWRLAPAYDLTFSDGPGGEHSMTVAGEGRTPGRCEVMELAADAGLKPREAAETLDEVRSAVAGWNGLATDTGIGTETQRRAGRAIEECTARLA